MTEAEKDLLGADDPSPVAEVNRSGAAPFLLIGDHAGNAIPKALDDLGVSEEHRARHIGWDIGTAALGRLLAERLDAPLLYQPYSRLVIDCNRDPAAEDAMPPVSDGTLIPGNATLDPASHARRVAAIHAPYQAAIADMLGRQKRSGLASVLVSLHSFTPQLSGGAARPWQIGILHDGHEDAFARRLLAWLQEQPGLIVGDNEPYRMDGTDHTVPRHAFAARLPYAEIEVRQDLIADAAGQERWADLLARGMAAAL